MNNRISPSERENILRLAKTSKYGLLVELGSLLSGSDLSGEGSDELRDKLIDLQSELGFDQDYNLNEDGVFLQSLIDRLLT